MAARAENQRVGKRRLVGGRIVGVSVGCLGTVTAFTTDGAMAAAGKLLGDVGMATRADFAPGKRDGTGLDFGKDWPAVVAKLAEAAGNRKMPHDQKYS